MLFFYVWPLYNPVTAETMYIRPDGHLNLLVLMLMSCLLGTGRLLCLEVSSWLRVFTIWSREGRPMLARSCLSTGATKVDLTKRKW
jgi:hypothetical protein